MKIYIANIALFDIYLAYEHIVQEHIVQEHIVQEEQRKYQQGRTIIMNLERNIAHNLEDTAFHITTIPNSSFYIHYHTFYEIYYFAAGDADYLVEGKEYHLTPNSLILLSPNMFHGVRVNSDVPYIRYAVHFDPGILPPERRNMLISSFPGNQKNSPREAFYEHTEDYQLEIYLKHLVSSERYQPIISDKQYSTIFLEALLAQISMMSQTLRPTRITYSAPDTITDIIRYLNNHLTESISLDSLSSQFFISKYYMNRAFKKATGTTVMDYLTYKRIVMARQLMLNGDSASAAAQKCGFGDYSSFYRAYRKVMGYSPSKDLQNCLDGPQAK